MKTMLCVCAILLAGAGCALADASYEESVRYTGGSLVDMMRSMSDSITGKVMGGRMGKALEDQTYKVYVKGNKMARLGAATGMIFDLDAGTLTMLDVQKKSYSTTTFDEINRRVEEVQQRMLNEGSNKPAEFQFISKVEPTGKTQEIDGQNAKEYVMTITAQGQQAGMRVKSYLWAVPSVAGMEELRIFQKKMTARLNNMGGFNPLMGTANSGLNALRNEVLKMEGFPVMQQVTVSGVQSPMDPMMAMRHGGQENKDPNAPFLIMTTDSKSFSDRSVTDSVFEIPAGYKEQKGRGR